MLSNYIFFCLFVFNIKTNMKIIVKTKITVGAGALSIQKLEYIPINIAINETNTEIIIMFLNLLFIKKAIAPGAIIKENCRVKHDTIMGVVFSGMFGFGIVLITKIETDVHLDHILFGNMLGVSVND